jgi:phosphatidylglycerophosphate synthase
MASAGPKIAVLKADAFGLVAGLPPAIRSAKRCAEELSPSEIVFSCDRPEDFAKRWRFQLAGLKVPFRVVSGAPEAALVLPGGGFPRAGALKAWHPNGAGPWTPQNGWISCAEPAGAAAAERELVASLPRATDGYLARFDRRLSIALSLRMLPFPITPNDITTASLVLGLAGAWLLATGNYGVQLAGAALLWFCCILDGCDGEVARLKLLSSPRGAAYDVAADHVAHLATFVAVPFAIHHRDPSASFVFPGVVLVAGFLACVFSVWWLVLRVPEDEQGPYSLLIERVASRDYVYLILALAAVDKLSWFLWAAGIGSHVFWAALWLVALRSKPRPNS